MKHIKLIYLVIICVIGLVVSSCWFKSDDWELEPQYISCESLDFGSESESQIFYIFNNGGHSQISYSISVSDKWIVPSIATGTIAKDEDKTVTVKLNRTYLPEGNNLGKIIVLIDNNPYVILVSAIGNNKISVYPEYLNFGSNDDITYFTIRSLSGSREIEIIPKAEWLLVSDEEFSLPEYDPNKSETERKISVKCKRSLLAEGDYSSSIDIVSGLGSLLQSLPVSVTIPSLSSQTVAIDNYVFSLAKHLYWEDNNVILEMGIKNYKYYKTFELIGPSSYALADNGSKYSVETNSRTLEPNTEGIMKIKILNVDKPVRTFTSIVLCIRDLSDKIVFQNVELQ